MREDQWAPRAACETRAAMASPLLLRQTRLVELVLVVGAAHDVRDGGVQHEAPDNYLVQDVVCQ